MPTITIDGLAEIPGKPGRKALVLYLHTGSAVFGWGDMAGVYPAAGGLNGIPLPLGQMVTFCDPENKAFAQVMRLYNDSGPADLTYQEAF